MLNSFQSKISGQGLNQLSDPLEYRRVLLVNQLSLIGIFICVVIGFLLFFEGLFPQYPVVLSGALLYGLVLIFNKRGQYRMARHYFLLLSVGILIASSVIAYYQGRFNGVEDILIAYMAVSFFLFDGRMRYVGYFAIYAIFIAMKVIKQHYLLTPFDFNFYITIQNATVLSLIVFLFVNAFKESLMRAFLRLKAQDEVLYSMIDNVPLFIAMVDKEFNYKMVNLNYEKSFNKKRDEIIGANVKEVLPSNILDSHIPMLEQVFKGESQEFLEETLMPDGSKFFAAGKYIPIKNELGQVVAATVYVNDVTKLEEAKNKLKDVNQTKDRLFSIVAHDIRGPFNLLENILNVSSDDLLTREQFFEYIHTVQSKLEAMKNTVDTLLDWARSQLDGVSVNPTKVELIPIIEQEIAPYKDYIQQKKIDFSFHYEDDMTVWMDENHLKIAIRNLIHNAIKFTPKKGKVSISLSKLDHLTLVKISDDGVGMDSDKVNSILDKELQSSVLGTAGEKGSGIGLSLSLGLLEKNNCEIALNSKLDQGTTFEILIPAG